MQWFKKHADSLVTISVIIGGIMWMNSKLNEIQKDITVIKTVMVQNKREALSTSGDNDPAPARNNI